MDPKILVYPITHHIGNSGPSTALVTKDGPTDPWRYCHPDGIAPQEVVSAYALSNLPLSTEQCQSILKDHQRATRLVWVKKESNDKYGVYACEVSGGHGTSGKKCPPLLCGCREIYNFKEAALIRARQELEEILLRQSQPCESILIYPLKIIVSHSDYETLSLVKQSPSEAWECRCTVAPRGQETTVAFPCES